MTFYFVRLVDTSFSHRISQHQRCIICSSLILSHGPHILSHGLYILSYNILLRMSCLYTLLSSHLIAPTCIIYSSFITIILV
ncbi:hypothetical protein BD769DRAFT_1415248 [Suillus cothurnatus]|nr:hypothetical protein BD769DRAFT_1415248 [Suillus cothurnatus]